MRWKKSLILFIFLFNILLGALSADSSPILAISDLIINSDNSAYRYLGKGFSEIISFELRKSRRITLIDREKRNDALEEMRLSLSGLTDESQNLELGKLLTASHLVFGEITDMGDTLLIHLKMMDVETSEIVWSDQIMEPGGHYAFIGASLAKSLLDYFQIGSQLPLEKEKENPMENNTKAVIALSQGVNALDEGNKEEALEKLTEAKVLNPKNEVIGYLISRTASLTARLKVVPERYITYYNPAYLGSMNLDRLSANLFYSGIIYGEYDSNNKSLEVLNPSGEYGTRERTSGGSFSYAFPAGETLGFSFDYLIYYDEAAVVDFRPSENHPTLGNNNINTHNLFLSSGWEVSPNLNIGMGVGGTYHFRKYYRHSVTELGYQEETQWAFSGILALLIKNRDQSILFDMAASWGTEKNFWYDPDIDQFNSYQLPLYTEETLTFKLKDDQLFLAVKQVNDFNFSRGLYYSRLMPCLEQRLSSLFSYRLGLEGALFSLKDSLSMGFGATTGVTFTHKKMNYDANLTFRMRPSILLEDTIIPELLFFVTVSRDGLFFK